MDKLRGSESYVGRTHGLAPQQRRKLATLLTGAPATPHRRHQPSLPQPLPASWSGQLPYIQVEPAVVMETSVDAAFERSRWRHLVHIVRPRLDLSVYDVPLITGDKP